jgi:hypothetical protein
LVSHRVDFLTKHNVWRVLHGRKEQVAQSARKRTLDSYRQIDARLINR